MVGLKPPFKPPRKSIADLAGRKKQSNLNYEDEEQMSSHSSMETDEEEDSKQEDSSMLNGDNSSLLASSFQSASTPTMPTVSKDLFRSQKIESISQLGGK